MKTRYNDVLRLRCDRHWKQDLKDLAERKKLDASDIVRLVMTEYMDNERPRFINPIKHGAG